MSHPTPDVLTAVESLHADLAQWLGTAAPDEVFDRFAAAQHPAFTMVTTAGAVVARDDLLTGLRGARNAQPGLTIEITEVDTLLDDGTTVVLRFLERHLAGGTATARRVTAVLVTDGQDGLRWRAVHETPLP
ncbi:nuclear transport factor 2 family protein [Nocardia rhizosphaerihabitans]|uniref:nuclear transport factor 2 family protein n=1 Tax=Nocardia rhizosphaerihabitans TaxID=1691570 RepID=UPI00367302C0